LTSGDQTFCAGSNDPSNITFSTAPSGGAGTYSYQWYYQDGLPACPSGTSTAGWTLIGGATSNSYDPPSGLTNSRTYAVLVDPTGTPDCGVATWANNCRKITVLPAVNFGTLTNGDQIFCAGPNDPGNIISLQRLQVVLEPLLINGITRMVYPLAQLERVQQVGH
jgi:hypothetical protein